MDIMQNASDWLQGMQKAHASIEITYSRGADSVTVLATRGRQRRATADVNGHEIAPEARDYLIHAADLILAGQRVLPDLFDEITEPGGGVYRVVPGDSGELHYTFSDPYRTRLRIHTRRISD